MNRAARMAAEAVASLRLNQYRGRGPMREQVDTVWQARLFSADAYNEYQTRFAFWETVAESLKYRGNAYVWKNADPSTGRVVELCALHPDQVTCMSDGTYRVEVTIGYVDPTGRGVAKYLVEDEVILHIRGHGEGGKLEAPSPIKVFADALQSPLGRMRHENRMWRRGTALQQAIVFPPGVTQPQADVWREAWSAAYEGTDGETTAVVGGGASIQQIGMTLADAQFVEMARLTVHDASFIFGVPANLLGAQIEHGIPNLEQDLATWLRFGLGPDLERIESAVNADETLYPSGTGGSAGSVYSMFDAEEFVRGSLTTEDNIAHQRIQDGRLMVDEWRRSQGLPPLPDGAGSIPQITPVAGGANPIPTTIPKSSATD
jgi:HK97 family phage portal protein